MEMYLKDTACEGFNWFNIISKGRFLGRW